MGISITLIIVIATCISSYLAFNNAELKEKLSFRPYAIQRQQEYQRFLSVGFVHADFMHLAFNMYVLYTFGEQIEFAFSQYFGPLGNLYYLLLYFGGMVIAGLHDFYQHKDHYAYHAVGASGAVSAIVFSYILLAPLAGLTFIFFPFFSIPAVILGGAYLAYSWWAANNSNDNIGHNAHFWGAVYGFLITIAFRPAFLGEFFATIMAAVG